MSRPCRPEHHYRSMLTSTIIDTGRNGDSTVVCSYPTSTAPPTPRLDALPSELVMAICAYLLNGKPKLPRERPSSNASADLAHLARAAPNCFVPAITMAVRDVDRICQVKPNPDAFGAWIVTGGQPGRANDLAGYIALDVHSPPVVDNAGVARPRMNLVLTGSLKDGILPGMAVPCPIKAIRHMQVTSSPWFFDHAGAVPPKLKALVIKGTHLNAKRCQLLMAHLPPTLRRFELQTVHLQCEPMMLLRGIPHGVQDLALVGVYLIDYFIELLARSFPPALRSLRLVHTGLAHPGLVAVLAALPTHQLELLDLSVNIHGLEMMAALAAWLAQSTRLTHLVLNGLDRRNTTAADSAAIAVVLNALPPTLRSLHLNGTLHTTEPLAAAISRVPRLEVLDVGNLRRPSARIDVLFPVLPATLQCLRLGFTALNHDEMLAGLTAAHARGMRWSHLTEVDFRNASLTEPSLDAILAALKCMVSAPTGQQWRRRTRILVTGNLSLLRSSEFAAAKVRWTADGWNLVF
ncbi:hypothetical protein AMAG_06270 [Allomyces macrogynus ATCC 38327]|uniref:F-box domain-containing protein n=1 Tax=Allomyces macrogynus (strain ATCC 38327) TaxID=578462 RepID=A0A0L0SG73_ALLM3|nr:hypothetical protein AMAG_06270 [Allomyces macrogynus ATCC 38327]|eukprot:KNE61444.1 hypothetical protein AMAG_06270 [Allomyces macrogynus ATCC 38327]